MGRVLSGDCGRVVVPSIDTESWPAITAPMRTGAKARRGGVDYEGKRQIIGGYQTLPSKGRFPRADRAFRSSCAPWDVRGHRK
ncbi:hypothetical protein GCM10027440_47290 [Nocardiopsis coralliicola]